MAMLTDAVRISVHLPTYDPAHIQAAKQVIAYYKFRYGGSTTSTADSSHFNGAWPYLVKSRKGNYTKLYEARVCIMMIDVVFSGQRNYNSIPAIVEDIKNKSIASYTAFRCKQKAFWITVSDLSVSV